jgi:hypothetical protein
MGDSAGSGNGVRNRANFPQPESRPSFYAARPEPAPKYSTAPESISGAAPTLLFDSASGGAPVEPASNRPTDKPTPQRIPRWLERAELVLRVLLRMYIGLAICYAPWSHIFWDQNPLFVHFPALSAIASNGAVRGIVSGLGLLNLWIALQDAMHHGDR